MEKEGDGAVLYQSAKYGLGALRAAEFHIGKDANDGIEDGWCKMKHLTDLSTHFADEAVQHCESSEECTDETLGQLRSFVTSIDRILDRDESPSQTEIKTHRNWWREIWDEYFPHLMQVEGSKECDVCKDDSLTDEERLHLLKGGEKE